MQKEVLKQGYFPLQQKGVGIKSSYGNRGI